MTYRTLRQTPVVSAGLVLTVGLLVPVVVHAQSGAAGLAPAGDARKEALTRFFDKHQSKLTRYVDEFLAAADRHQLDWRLLPGLAMIESSGGKYYQHGNIFGWDSGRTHFSSIEACIQHVARRLAESPVYRGKSVTGILTTYNPARKDYALKVLEKMRELAPDHLALR